MKENDSKIKIKRSYYIPSEVAETIIQQCGSIEAFIYGYKRSEFDNDVIKDFFNQKNVFIGGNAITVFSKDITVAEKRKYINLVRKLGVNIDINSYIDLDILEETISSLSKEEQKFIRLRFGFEDGIEYTQYDIGDKTKKSQTYVSLLQKRVFNKLKESDQKKSFIRRGSINAINESIERIEKRKIKINKIEDLLIYIYENEGNDNATLEDAGIEFSDKEKIYIDNICRKSSRKFIKTIQDLRDNKDILEAEIESYYRELNSTFDKKEQLEQEKERYNDFSDIYERAKNGYLKDEDIFNPDYVIKGTKRAEINVEEKTDFSKSIYCLNLSLMAMIYLHNNGISRIEDFRNIQIEDILNKSESLSEDDKKQIKECYSIINSDSTEIQKKLYINRPISELDLSESIKNIFMERNIKYVSDILKLYYEGNEKWSELKCSKGIGPKASKEILDLLEKLGYTKNERPVYRFLEELNEKTPICELTFDCNSKNSDTLIRHYLQRAGIKNVGDILHLYDETIGWGKLIKVCKIGEKNLNKIFETLEKSGFLKDGVPVNRQKNNESKEEMVEQIIGKQEVIHGKEKEIGIEIEKAGNQYKQEIP